MNTFAMAQNDAAWNCCNCFSKTEFGGSHGLPLGAPPDVTNTEGQSGAAVVHVGTTVIQWRGRKRLNSGWPTTANEHAWGHTAQVLVALALLLQAGQREQVAVCAGIEEP
jgi:hypothetical protein